MLFYVFVSSLAESRGQKCAHKAHLMSNQVGIFSRLGRGLGGSLYLYYKVISSKQFYAWELV